VLANTELADKSPIDANDPFSPAGLFARQQAQQPEQLDQASQTEQTEQPSAERANLLAEHLAHARELGPT
jgi:hypothetical protein